MKLVISDTSPLHYLILIGKADVLPAMYERIIAPAAVLRELEHPGAPEEVRQWASVPPRWLEVAAHAALIELARPLDPGEHAAISLAVELQADLILLDESDGRKAARAMNLQFIGTVGVLVSATKRKVLAKRGAEAAIDALRRTNKRIKPRILDEALAIIRAL